MNTAYVPDNTRSSIVIVLSLALAAGVIAALVGLSEKPDVPILLVSSADAASVGSAESNVSTETINSPAAIEFDEAGDPIIEDDAMADDAVAGDPLDPAASSALVEDPETELTPDSVEQPEALAIPAATPEPTPTPEVAAAVEPTPVPSVGPTPDVAAIPPNDATDQDGFGTGSVEGAFFTRPDEDEGAIVAQNQVLVSFNDDGSGTFSGILDITYADETRIYLEMSGALVWTSGNPQVKATVTGTYGFDAIIDADDVASEEGELSITSLESGSGSLCAPKCFGFTFPQQRRL